jgi:hypothetical protein
MNADGSGAAAPSQAIDSRSFDCLTPAELAARLGVEPKVLRHWRRRGVGPAFVRLIRAVRYPAKTLADWQATGSPLSAPAPMTLAPESAAELVVEVDVESPAWHGQLDPIPAAFRRLLARKVNSRARQARSAGSERRPAKRVSLAAEAAPLRPARSAARGAR